MASTDSTESQRLLGNEYDNEIALDIQSLALLNQRLRNNPNEIIEEQALPNHRDYELYERLGSFGQINNIDVGR